MAGLLYFFPQGRPVSTLAQVPDASLRELLAGGSLNCAQNNRGPDGSIGQLLSVLPSRGSNGVEARTGFFADAQTWQAVEEEDPLAVVVEDGQEKPVVRKSYWIGWETAAPPTPADVQREKLVDGFPVRLADGNDWIIPVCGPLDQRLPQSFHPAPGKKLTMRVLRQYQAIAAESEKWFSIVAAGGQEFRWTDAYAYACNLLAVNYRIGWHEAGFLGLITTETFVDVLMTSLGEPERRDQIAIQKKMTDAALPVAASAASPGD